MRVIDLDQPGAWASLFDKALSLMSHLEQQIAGAQWAFGGGTVLMLRIGHRQSKDIDLFVPDPQYLGYVNPRLSDAAGHISDNYEESAEFVKLILPEGEIDVIASQALTEKPFDLVDHRGRSIKVETSAEIIAKKMWHRGDRAKARDIFDLCAVADAEPEQLRIAAPFFAKHGEDFRRALVDREDLLRREFGAIDVIGPAKDFDACLAQAKSIADAVLSGKPV